MTFPGKYETYGRRGNYGYEVGYSDGVNAERVLTDAWERIAANRRRKIVEQTRTIVALQRSLDDANAKIEAGRPVPLINYPLPKKKRKTWQFGVGAHVQLWREDGSNFPGTFEVVSLLDTGHINYVRRVSEDGLGRPAMVPIRWTWTKEES